MRNKYLVWLYQPYKYLILIPLAVADTIVFTVFTWLLSLLSPKAAGYAAKCWAKVIHWLTPMPVKLVGAENIKKGQSYVIVANHQSAYDIILVYGSLPIDFRWIMKQELRAVPCLGFACENCGHIFLDRSSARKAYRSIQRAKEILTGGTSVVIFPEGHRSGRPQMNEFKHGAFRMAFELGLPMLPVSIKDTCRVMPGGIETLFPARATLTIHPAVDVNLYEGRRDELIKHLQDVIASAV